MLRWFQLDQRAGLSDIADTLLRISLAQVELNSVERKPVG